MWILIQVDLGEPSGRVLGSKQRGHGFEPQRHLCVVSLIKSCSRTQPIDAGAARHIYPSLVLVQPRKTPPYITERLLIGRKESNKKKSGFTLFSKEGTES